MPRASAPLLRLLAPLICLIYLWVSSTAARPEEVAPARNADYTSVRLRRLPPGVVAVDVFIDGERARLIVDTGDGVPGIGLTTSTARRLKLKTEPSARTVRGVSGARLLSSESGRAGSLRFGNNSIRGDAAELRDVPVQVAAFPVLEAQEKDATGRLPVDGFLGADTLRACGAIIDLPAGRLHVRRPAATGNTAADAGDTAPSPREGMVEIVLRTDPGLGEPLWVVPVAINGAAATMLVDTGNWATRVAAREASRLGLRGVEAGQTASDAAGVEVKTERASARTFLIAGVAVPAALMPPLLLGPMGAWAKDDLIGALGIDTLRACGAVIDCGRGRLYLRRPL